MNQDSFVGPISAKRSFRSRFALLILGLLALGVVGAILGCESREKYNALQIEKGGFAHQLSSEGLPAAAEAKQAAISGGVFVNGQSGIMLPPGTALSREEELWVIQRPQTMQSPRPAEKDDLPGSGALMARVPKKDQPVPVPLKHTDVKASIAGYIATVDVTQQYHNPYDTKIEAIYVFPLPHNAAVNDFLMTIGDRRIRGIIREREEAQRIYAEAKRQGYVASLLTQERPNIFTQAVANIEPGKQIDINIKYFHTLTYADGWYEFVFPMVVGPRFNPPGMTDGIGAVGTSSRGASGQSTEIQYLRPDQRTGHDISLAIDIDAGVPIESVLCRSHEVTVKHIENSRTSVVLNDRDRIPNRDFVLRYQVAGNTTKSAMLAYRGEQGGYFTLMLVPPANLTRLDRKPLEMVFTLDVSGSMSGRPIEQAKAAVRYALTHMDSRDTFQVITFDNTARKLFDSPQPVTQANVEKALRFIKAGQGGGGTMMIEGIRASLDFPHDESRLRFVSFLTDGYIGNEREILAEIRKSLGPSRIFSFGVGSSPNRYLLDHMAKLGNGAVAYLSLQDNAEAIMAMFLDRISHPALIDISIDFGSLQVADVYPQRIPDLFVGRPVILTGRFTGPTDGAVRIKGVAGAEVKEMLVPICSDEPAPGHQSLAAIWARNKIADLADRSTWDPSPDLPDQIKQVALEYGLMSPYTSFIAVDSLTRTASDRGVTVNVPVPVPDGVKYDTAVQESAEIRR